MVLWHEVPVAPSLADLTVVAEDIDFTSTEVVTTTTLTVNHYLVKVDASSGNIRITLPAIASHVDREYTIIKTDSTGNKVTIVGTINGEENLDLTLQYQYVIIHADDDGDEWLIIGGEYVKIEELLEKNFSLQLEQLEAIAKNTDDIVSQLEKASDEEREEKE